MSRQSASIWVALRLSPGAKGLGAVLLSGVILGSAPAPAEAGWAAPFLRPLPVARVTQPDQSWLMDIPEKPGGHSKGKVAVFVFKGDDFYQPVRAAVVRVLRRRGLNVTATLRPADSAAQYREMSAAANLAVFVEGELSGAGARQSARIRIRSGVSGQRIASVKFSGPTPKIVEAVGRTLWTRVGATTMHACSNASRPRRREREPLHIEAGLPEDTPIASRGP